MAMERTKEMCTPRERWTPEQSRQNTVPKDTDALCAQQLCINSPLRIFHATVAAFVIAWYGFDHCLVAGGHLHHFDECVIVYLE
eukprot:scaffold1702_cov128-Skeletonema_dohrnii-CCMP3373.AAC.6